MILIVHVTITVVHDVTITVIHGVISIVVDKVVYKVVYNVDKVRQIRTYVIGLWYYFYRTLVLIFKLLQNRTLVLFL